MVTPAPRMLKAGAVWVTIHNWMTAAAERWGKAVVITPDGVLSSADVIRVAWGEPATYGPLMWGRLGQIRSIAETGMKDVRSWWRMSRFNRSVRTFPLRGDSLFVWQHHDLFQRAGFTIARRHGCPVVLFVDAPVVWEAERWGVRRPFWGAITERLGEYSQFRDADVVACVSEEVAAAAVLRGADPERVLITPCTADGIRSAIGTTDVRARYRLDETTVVGWVGSFRPFHHADSIIRAVAEIQEHANVGLLMVGSGPTLDACRRLAAHLQLRRATFTGAVPHEEIGDHLLAMDIAVVPSGVGREFHYSPLKLKEFMAAGRAVVAPAVGEIARNLTNGHDVMLYPPGDEASMIAAIRDLVESKPKQRSLGVQARITYDRLFTMERQLDQLTERLGLGN